VRHQLPTAATVHIDPQVVRVLHRVGSLSDPHNIAIGPRHDSRLSKDVDMVLFDLTILRTFFEQKGFTNGAMAWLNVVIDSYSHSNQEMAYDHC
jgi:hypothetical protein